LSGILGDKRFTIFEKKVYAAVMKIPRGETRTYKWVAARIGRPNASRAVGGALKRNPYSPFVPCHRVVRSDGSVGGFSRGAAVKARLLVDEGAVAFGDEGSKKSDNMKRPGRNRRG
jgi:methylated-DNA-[protein]-cysteine S-methyltransferase